LGSQRILWIGEERWIDESCQIILNWFPHPLCHKPPNWKKQMASNDIVNFIWPQSWETTLFKLNEWCKIITLSISIRRINQILLWLKEKLKRFKNYIIFGQPTGNYCSKYENFRKQNPQNMATLALFFHKIPCMNHIGLFFKSIVKKKKKNISTKY